MSCGLLQDRFRTRRSKTSSPPRPTRSETIGLPPVRFHDLRHGHATIMLLQGVHPKVVSERLGHSSIGITLDIYSHVLPSMQAQAASAFDSLFVASEGSKSTA